MSRYIDAQKLLDWIKDSLTMYGNTYNTDQLNMWGLFEEIIKNTPTADVEPVVRCKDCKHATDTKEKGVFNICWQHSDEGEEVYPNGFCSYGERKSDE